MRAKIEVRREDRERAEKLLELAGIKVFRPRGVSLIVSNSAYPMPPLRREDSASESRESPK